MNKKIFVALAIAITGILFCLFMWVFPLPVLVGGMTPGNVPLLMVSRGIVAVAAGLFITLCLALIFKREFVKNQLNTLMHFRHLLVLMVKRDFVTRYRRNVLGILWSLLNPLLSMLVIVMVFSQLFDTGDIPVNVSFAVYVLSGKLIFEFFSESTLRAMNSIVASSGIIKKVYVPKYIFPVSNTLSSMVNLGFSFIAFLLVFIVMGEQFHWTFLLIPIPVFYTLVFSLGVGMFLASLTVFFRDLTYLYGVFTSLLFFLTPIIYHISILPARVFHLMHLNPLFHFVEYFRELAINGTVPGLWANIFCAGFAIAAFCMGLYMMMSQQDKYILYV
jgi:ABC-type polysaccharide/polyol phosphate export permease